VATAPDGTLWLTTEVGNENQPFSDIRLLRYQDGTWETVVSQYDTGFYDKRPAIVVDATGAPVIAWMAGDFSATNYRVYVARWDGTSLSGLGGSLTGAGVSDLSDHAGAPAVALTAEGYPVVAYIQEAAGGNWVAVKAFDGAQWRAYGANSSTMPGLGLNTFDTVFNRTHPQQPQGMYPYVAKLSMAGNASGTLFCSWVTGFGVIQVYGKRYFADGGASLGFVYTNDAVDRLSSVETDVATLIEYDYDLAGNRLGKEVSALLNIAPGEGMPASRGIGNGDADAAVAQFALSSRPESEGALLSGMSFALSGTGNDSTALTRAELWHDANGNGARDAGDTMLASTGLPTADDGVLTFSGMGLIIPGGEVRHVLLTYDLNGSAPSGATFTARVADGKAVRARGAVSGRSLYVLGAPVDGAVLTVSSDTTPPIFAGILSAEPSNGQVVIGWNKATDNEDAPELLAYAVWVESVPPTGTGAPDFITPGVPALDEEGNNAAPSMLFFTVRPLENGVEQHFLVRAQDTKGNRSANTETLAATPLAPVFELNVSSQNGAVVLSPEGGIYEVETVVTLTPVPDEGYVFNGWSGDVAVNDYGTAPLTLVMNQPYTLSAAFTVGTGAVEVAVTPDNAPWIVTDADGVQHTGTGDAFVGALPVGAASIDWGNLAGMLAPLPDSAYLAAEGTVRFAGQYTPLTVGDDCIDCIRDTKTAYNVGETACLGVSGTFPEGTLFQWSKQGEGVLMEGRFIGVNCQTLSIADLDEDDSGTYICEYEGQKSLYSVTITVGSPGVPLDRKLLIILPVMILLSWVLSNRKRQSPRSRKP
jgi:hypothetical protein